MSQKVTVERMDQLVGSFVRDKMRSKPNEPVQTWVDLAIKTNAKIHGEVPAVIVTPGGVMSIETYNARMPEVVKGVMDECHAFWDAHPQQDYRKKAEAI